MPKPLKESSLQNQLPFPNLDLLELGKKQPISMISWLLDGLLSKSGCGFLHLDSGNADVVPWDLGKKNMPMSGWSGQRKKYDLFAQFSAWVPILRISHDMMAIIQAVVGTVSGRHNPIWASNNPQTLRKTLVLGPRSSQSIHPYPPLALHSTSQEDEDRHPPPATGTPPTHPRTATPMTTAWLKSEVPWLS